MCPAEVLKPRNTWKDTAAYDRQARKLAQMFADNFKTFEADARRGRARRRAAVEQFEFILARFVIPF